MPGCKKYLIGWRQQQRRAISFDQPSVGTGNSPSKDLNIQNNGIGGALECLANTTRLYAKSATGNGVHAESLGGGNGLYAKSATGEAIHVDADLLM